MVTKGGGTLLEHSLRESIPNRVSKFPKIDSDRDPYYFDSWDQEGGVVELYFAIGSGAETNPGRIKSESLFRKWKYLLNLPANQDLSLGMILRSSVRGPRVMEAVVLQ